MGDSSRTSPRSSLISWNLSSILSLMTLSSSVWVVKIRQFVRQLVREEQKWLKIRIRMWLVSWKTNHCQFQNSQVMVPHAKVQNSSRKSCKYSAKIKENLKLILVLEIESPSRKRTYKHVLESMSHPRAVIIERGIITCSKKTMDKKLITKIESLWPQAVNSLDLGNAVCRFLMPIRRRMDLCQKIAVLKNLSCLIIWWSQSRTHPYIIDNFGIWYLLFLYVNKHLSKL